MKKGLWYTLLFSLIGLILIFKGIAADPVKFELKSLNFSFLGLGLLALLIVWFSKAFRIYVIAQGMGEKIGLVDCFQIYLATCFVSHVTPFNAGGTPLQIYLLHKKGLSLGKATAVTTIDLGLHSIVYLLIFIGTLSLNVSLLKQGGFLNQDLIRNFWVIIISLIAAGGVFYFIFRLSWAKKLGGFLKEKGWLKRLRQEFFLFKEGSLLLIHSNWSGMFKAVLASIVYWFFYLLLAPLIILAMNKAVEFFSLMYSQLIFNVVQTLIPTPGGSGGAEVLLSYLFRGITGIQGLGLFVLLWRVYTFYSSLLVGGYLFFKLTIGTDNQGP
ncbi:MAG: lysylphosphatidylglycerol synthase transmembrane domain-containing protein [Bacteroidota bacterium]